MMNVPTPLVRYRRSSGGYTLIEVMISILIFSVGVLGTVALQARAAQFAAQNGDRSRASILANQMVSTMWAYQTMSPAPAVVAPWQTMVATPSVSGLPNGVGSITTNGTSATISITWKAPSAAASAASSSYSTIVVIQ